MADTGTPVCDLLDLGCHLDSFSGWLNDEFHAFLAEIFDSLGSAVAAIPVPSWLASVSFDLPPGVLWFGSVLELHFGATVMIAAWVLRFAIRRIPFIG